MNLWHEVWERKGREGTSDLKLLDGFESTTIRPEDVAEEITKLLHLEMQDALLEVGCGAGMLAQFLKCRYTGVDYSSSLVKKHIELLHNSVLVGEAADLVFKDRSFDKVLVFSIFQYFPNHEYAKRVLSELVRVAKKAVFIGDIPVKSHSADHLLYTREFFSGWEVSEGFYNPDRFNALLPK